MPRITPRQAITLTFICFGVCVGSNVGALPVLQARSGVTPFIFGFMAALGTVANILMMALGGLINRRFDHRSVLLFILPLVFATFVYSMSVASIFSFALSFVVFNLAIGTLDLFMNAEGSVIEHDIGKPVLSSFHGAVLYAMATFGLIGSYVSVNFGPLWATLPALPFIAAALYAVHTAIPHRVEHGDDAPRARVHLPYKALLLIGAVLGLDVAAELACIQWSAQLLAQLQPSLAAYSGLGVAFYGVCNGSVRMLGDGLRARFGDINLIYVSFAVGFAGFAILATTPGFAVSVLAFALVGMGLALIFPVMFAVAGHLVPEARAAALSFTAAVSGIPRFFSPILLGSLAASYGLNSIYAAAAIACAIALGFVAWAALEIAKEKRALVAQRPVT